MDSSATNLPARLELAGPGVWVAEADLQFVASRSRGPGGQSVNKVSSAMQLRLPVTAIRGLDPDARQRLRRLAGQRVTRDDELLINSDAHRSQWRNRKACLDRLAEFVAAAARPPRVRRPTRPGRGAVERRLESKRRQSQKKQRRRGGWE